MPSREQREWLASNGLGIYRHTGPGDRKQRTPPRASRVLAMLRYPLLYIGAAVGLLAAFALMFILLALIGK